VLNWTLDSEKRYARIAQTLVNDLDKITRDVWADLPPERDAWGFDIVAQANASIRVLVCPLLPPPAIKDQLRAGEQIATHGDIFAKTIPLRLCFFITQAVRRAIVRELLSNAERTSLSDEICCVEERFDAVAMMIFENGDKSPARKSESGGGLENELNIEQARFDAVNQMIRGIAHESRNSLQRIDACVEMLLLDVAEDPELFSMVQRLQQAASDLKGLYEEIRQYSAPLHLKSSTVKLSEIITQAWKKSEPMRRPRTILFRVKLQDPDVELPLDQVRVEEALHNIFECCLKCSQDPVIIRVTGTIDPTEPDNYELTIDDNGSPVDEKYASQATEPFVVYRAKSPLLGIAFASRIVRAHGGSIDIPADQTEGVSYRLRLPLSDKRLTR